MDNIRPTWAEIDLGAIRNNLVAMKKKIPDNCLLMAVVKANAYGHGMIHVAQTSLQTGADYLGVATLEEALTLREHGIDAPILVLGYIPDSSAQQIVEQQIDATIFSFHEAEAISKAAVASSQKACLHIKIDTGMSRIGFLPNQNSLQVIEKIKNLPGVILKGIFSHFAAADVHDKTFAYEQMHLFADFIACLEAAGISIPLKHIANSAAIMDIPGSYFNMVRAGITTYGLYPSSQVEKKNLELIPAMRLISKIAYLKTVPAGVSISYGRTYYSQHDITVATVPIGYADGYSRLLSNRIWATVGGERVPQVGTICMDQCMFDVSRVKDIKEGDEIILFGRPEDGITADNIADTMGTINYEVVCAISARVPRVYIK